MTDESHLVVIMTHGPEDERASVGFTIANGGMTAGQYVSVFLTSGAVDIVRRRAADHAHASPLDPLAELIRDFLSRGGTLWACAPCVKARGYEQDDLIDGVIITGAAPMHELLKSGAAALSF